MRRADREITNKDEMLGIIKKAAVCRIGLSENNIPYVVPLNFGYSDNSLYFHSAKEGKKLEIIKRNNCVCFEFDIDDAIIEKEKACEWSGRYRSVIGYGKAFLIENAYEKKKALNIIMQHYSGKSSFEYKEKAIEKIVIVKITIENMTGKKANY